MIRMTAMMAAIVFMMKQKYLVATSAFVVTLGMTDACAAMQANQQTTPTNRHAYTDNAGNQAESQPARLQKPAAKKITLTGRFHLVAGTRHGVLILRTEISDGNHIYSLTQKGSPPPSKISVKKSSQFRIEGTFSSDRHPKVVAFDPLFQNRLEKHSKLVQFFVPIEIGPGIDPAQVKPEIIFDGQVCSDEGICVPIQAMKTVAVFAGFYANQAQKQSDSQFRKR